MNPVTHLLLGWTVANVDTSLNRRERTVITLAGVAPDLDGLGLVAEVLTRGSKHELLWWSNYHHTALHNISFAVLVAIVAFLVTGRRWRVALLAFASFHIHLLGDLLGARGPENDHWPIPYLTPFSDRWQWIWDGQWELNAWPNFVITGVLLALTFYWAWKRGYSPLEMVSCRADQAFVQTLRERFPIRR
ncbi:LexA-binding, inner membrane-associated putative hydrolase [Trichlorobacter thiogenes]|uniref:LexA-binding, inner membrane-associated putative hydrolase n=1 Tax=Trichlorobacter thiogenes TaxID=115783 RepID=A0A1T4NAI7_9BACT|nr:metal-dependent hydrolase [Trichlorobacter thiogenes]SJZ76320.1 LexA-binding, inner membrane-associated putative hydrolase [Trichlorobacter thiogenes]